MMDKFDIIETLPCPRSLLEQVLNTMGQLQIGEHFINALCQNVMRNGLHHGLISWVRGKIPLEANTFFNHINEITHK